MTLGDVIPVTGRKYEGRRQKAAMKSQGKVRLSSAGEVRGDSLGLESAVIMIMASTRHSEGADAVVRFMEIFAEQIHNLQADFGMLVEKGQQVLAADLGGLDGVHDLGSDLVGPAGKDSAQAEDFTGRGGAQGHAPAVFRADGKPHPALAKQVDGAGSLAFAEQHGSALVSLHRLDPVEFPESIGRQIAENAIRALRAIETTLRHKFYP